MQLLLKHPAEIVSFLTALTHDQQTGEVLLQSANQSAKVYLNEGKVVWAFATGQKESFQSILVKENLLSKDKLLEGIKGAREQGKKSLDEILLALGLSDNDQRQDIIERHTKAALQALQDWENCQAQFNSTVVDEKARATALSLDSLLNDLSSSSSRNGNTKSKSNPSSRPSYGQAEVKTEPVTNIQEALERFRLEIPSFVAAMIIDGETGMQIASVSDIEELDLEVTSAFFRNLSASAIEALQAMGKPGGCPLEEVLITSVDEYMLLKTLKDGAHFLYVSVEKTSNPAMARVVIKRYSEDLDRLLV